jgi:hypothetical protein
MAEGTKTGKPIGRPRVSDAIEQKVRAQLGKGTGIIKTAKLLGIGVGTVQRIKADSSPFEAAARAA